MPHRSLLTVAAALVSAVVLLPGTASAHPSTTENLSRRTYDSTPERSAGTWRIDGLTAGPLGGHLDMTATAEDGTLPTTRGECEPVEVDAVLTVSPGEVLTVHTHRAEACVHAFADSLSLNAWFRTRHVDYEGTEHHRPRVVGDGLIAAGQLFTGAQASFNATLRW